MANTFFKSSLLILIISGTPFVATFSNPWQAQHTTDYDFVPLVMDEDAPSITTQSANYQVDQGHSVVLSCEVDRLGNNSVIWKHGDDILWVLQGDPKVPKYQAVHPEPRIGRNGTSLIINDTRTGDDGTYTCELSPPWDNRHVEHQLQIRVPPTIWPTDHKHLIIVTSGESLNLSCSAAGTPQPTITWYKKKSSKLPGVVHGNVLSLHDVTRYTAGDYVCRADNGVRPSAINVITLDIRHEPDVFAENTMVYTGIGERIQLACHVFANPPPKVTWTRTNSDKRKSPVNPLRLQEVINFHSRRYGLEFDPVQKDDLTEYSCNATNFNGKGSATLTLSGKPRPVQVQSEPDSESEDFYSLQWEVESYAPILHFVVSYKNLTDVDTNWVDLTIPGSLGSSSSSSSFVNFQSHNFSNLSPGTMYTVRITARNEFGVSHLKEPFNFTTMYPVIVDEIDEDFSNSLEGDILYDDSTFSTTMEDRQGVSGDSTNIEGDGDSEGTTVSTEDELHNNKPSHLVSHPDGGGDDDDDPGGTNAPIIGAISGGGHTLTPSERRGQKIALVTAISLSVFFL